jgi:hypothetical protein
MRVLIDAETHTWFLASRGGFRRGRALSRGEVSYRRSYRGGGASDYISAKCVQP